jgi:hypothetical protein
MRAAVNVLSGVATDLKSFDLVDQQDHLIVMVSCCQTNRFSAMNKETFMGESGALE